MEKTEQQEKLIKDIAEIVELKNQVAADEGKPFEEKYRARDKAEAILSNIGDYALSETTQKLVEITIQNISSELYYETEETGESIKRNELVMKAWEDGFLKPVKDGKTKALLEVKLLNNIGFALVNKEETDKGLKYLLKSLSFYEVYKEMAEEEESFETEIIKTALKGETMFKQTTLLFYLLAQTFAKKGDRESAAKFCGKTLVHQLKEMESGEITGEWTPGEFVSNAIGLSEFYISEKHFRQARIILVAVLKLFGNDDTEHTSHLRTVFANLYKSLFEYNSNLIKDNKVKEADLMMINTTPLEINIDKIKPIGGKMVNELTEKTTPFELQTTYEDSKYYFKKSLGYYNKALSFFKLDGFVTEHCEITKFVVALYKLILILDKDPKRFVAIEKKRISLLTNLTSQINPKYYSKMYIEMRAEAGEAYTSLFEMYLEKVKTDPTAMALMNKNGKESIVIWEEVSKYFENEKDIEHQSYINCLYNVGRVYTKLYSEEKSEQKQYLTKALNVYQKVLNVITKMKKNQQVLTPQLEEQYKITNEFVKLLPIRISKL